MTRCVVGSGEEGEVAMTIERITKEEFLINYHFGGVLLPESAALVALPPGQGIKMPCQWKHSKRGSCSGAVTMSHVAKRKGFRIQTYCKNGYLHVWKEAR